MKTGLHTHDRRGTWRRYVGRFAPVRVAFAVALAGMPLVGGAPAVQAQSIVGLYDFTRPALDWYTLETEHFRVVFHHDGADQGSSRTARVVARIAEEIYAPITSLYQYRPDGKVTFVLKDFEDYSNGAAYFFDNKIEIWAPALDSPLRGDHNWLRNVIAHEFTHMVQVQATMKAGRRFPFLYFQYLDYEDVKRPDVLYGYPDVIVTYPVPTLNNPAWLAEGTAQYQRAFMHYDHWDTHRDMVLRTRVLAGEELTLAEMGGFYSHSSLLREAVYNQGFAFTHYLAATYGEDILRRLTSGLGKWDTWNVEKALKEVTGRDAASIYADWMGTLRREYEERIGPIRDHMVEGRLIEAEGFSNFYPPFFARWPPSCLRIEQGRTLQPVFPVHSGSGDRRDGGVPTGGPGTATRDGGSRPISGRGRCPVCVFAGLCAKGESRRGRGRNLASRWGSSCIRPHENQLGWIFIFGPVPVRSGNEESGAADPQPARGSARIQPGRLEDRLSGAIRRQRQSVPA